MKTYSRIFGSGPAGFIISLATLLGAMALESRFGGLEISKSHLPGYLVLGILSVATVSIIIWSICSLPLTQRGKNLVTNGAFKYFRHPLYGAFLSFFNFGLAAFLNNWIYVLWAVLQHPVWHWVIRGEERLMEEEFPGEYEQYSRSTGRFFPRLHKDR